MFILDPRFRKDDRRGCVASWDSSLPSPLGLTRGSRAMIPYFSGALMSPKSGISVAGSKACARMTVGGVSQAVCFFAGGDASRF